MGFDTLSQQMELPEPVEGSVFKREAPRSGTFRQAQCTLPFPEPVEGTLLL